MFGWRRSQIYRLPRTHYRSDAPVHMPRDSVHCSLAGALCYPWCTMGTQSVVRLTHLTDPHLYGGEGELLRGIATLPSLEATLAHARQRDWPPDALLVTGDLVQDDPAGYVHFRRLFAPLGLPVLCLPGNHDEPE